jgi:small-conductance mechanosensitive channel
VPLLERPVSVATEPSAARVGAWPTGGRPDRATRATRRLLVIVALAVALALAPGVRASGEASASAPEDGPAQELERAETPLAPVLVDGELLFSVRGVSAYPAERRARAIADGIRELAASGDPVTASSLRLEDQGSATFIVTDRGVRVMGVHDADARVERVDRRVLAQVYAARIVEAIAAWRGDRAPALLARHAVYALGAILALLVAAALGRAIVRRLRAAFARRYEARIRDLAIQSFQIVRGRQLWRLLDGLLNFAWAAAFLAASYATLRYVLSLFPWTRAAGNGLSSTVLEPLRSMTTGVVAALPRLVFLAIVFVVTRYVLKLARLFFEGVAAGTVKLQTFDAEWALPTYRLLRLFVVAFAVVIAYPYVPGSHSAAFKGVSLFVGVVFSLGSSSLIGNLIAGYSMTYRRAFRIGDRVKIGDHLGEVVQMRLLMTHLRTPKNEEVVVPNSTILNAEVVNFSSMARERGLILHSTVGIGYETPWRQVEALLLEAARRTPGLMPDPPPFVREKSLGDFCVTYEINVHSDAPQRMEHLYAELHRNILDVFNEYGVQIMTPAYEGDPESPKVVPQDRWYAAPAEPPLPPNRAAAVRNPEPDPRSALT